MTSQKPKFILDESLPPRQNLRTFNQNFDIKHINLDFGMGGTSDTKIYDLATREKWLVVTMNIKHIRKLLQRNKPTVISVTHNLSQRQIDLKHCKLARSLKSSDFHGKEFTIHA